MAPKIGPSLKELIENRNKAPSPKDKNKSKPSVNPPPPPPPQLPTDLGLKPNPDLRRKRYIEAPEEGEMALFKASSPDSLKTKGAGGSPSLIAERSLLWLKCVNQPTLGHPS